MLRRGFCSVVVVVGVGVCAGLRCVIGVGFSVSYGYCLNTWIDIVKTEDWNGVHQRLKMFGIV